MHYYQFHISDFNNGTRHLNRLERSIYRDLLDYYYDSESPITSDLNKVCRRVLAHEPEEMTIVENILAEYFIFDGESYTNPRADKEIALFQKKSKQSIAAGKASGKARRLKASERSLNERSTDDEQALNQPLTINHKPLTNNQETRVKKRFAPPTVKEIKIFCGEKGYLVDPERFFHFYESKNWMVGKNKMKSWHSALAGWNAKEKSKAKKVDLYNTTAPDGWVTEMRDDPLNNHIFEDEK